MLKVVLLPFFQIEGLIVRNPTMNSMSTAFFCVGQLETEVLKTKLFLIFSKVQNALFGLYHTLLESLKPFLIFLQNHRLDRHIFDNLP